MDWSSPMTPTTPESSPRFSETSIASLSNYGSPMHLDQATKSAFSFSDDRIVDYSVAARFDEHVSPKNHFTRIRHNHKRVYKRREESSTIKGLVVQTGTTSRNRHPSVSEPQPCESYVNREDDS